MVAEKKFGNLLVGLSIFVFGINFVSMKFLVEHLPPFTLIFLRFAIASIFLWLIVGIKRTKNKEKLQIEKEDKGAVIVTGFLGIAVYYSFNALALTYISASLSSLICAMIPIFTLLANVLIYKKKFKAFEIINFIIATFGVILVLDIRPGNEFNFSQIIGIVYMLLAIFSWIAYTIKTYELQTKYDSIYLLYKQTMAATVFLLILAFIDGAKIIKLINQTHLWPALIGNLMFVGIVSSALGYLLYIQRMKIIGVEIASLYMNLIPAITAIVSYIFLKEDMNGKKVFGIIIVIVSLYAIALKDKMWQSKG